jgi:hypothetical protein
MSSSSYVHSLKIKEDIDYNDLRESIIIGLLYHKSNKEKMWSNLDIPFIKEYLDRLNETISKLENKNSIKSFKDFANIFNCHISQPDENNDKLFIMIDSLYTSDNIPDFGFVLYNIFYENKFIEIKNLLEVMY